MKKIRIKKRNGSLEDFQIEKISKILDWSTQDLNGVSSEAVSLNAKLALYDGITSSEIHEILINSAANLISEQAPNYQFVASRLLNYHLRMA